MKKRFLTVATVLALCSSMLFTSCIGSFALTHKLLNWNQTVGSKFVNELVFVAFCILPVYEVSTLADLLVINSIEFWSGDNPVAMKKGSHKVTGTDGKEYLVVTDAKGHTVTCLETGAVTRFNFDEATRTWSVVANGQEAKLFTYIDDTHVSMAAPDGSDAVVELSAEGVLAYEQMAMPILWASK